MLLLLLALVIAVAAGALTARTIVRGELETFERNMEARLKAALADRPPVPLPAPVPMVAAPVATPVAAPVPAPAPPPPAPPPVVVAPPPAPAPVEQEVTPEILMVLTAAVAAFLGKRARIRSARVAPRYSDSAWAQQGRVFVQASHNLSRH